MPTPHEHNPSKIEFLRQEGTLNPAAQRVLDAKFRQNEFFDPHDLVQVKYEMLRRVSIDSASVAQVVQEYGVSRPTYYQAKANLERAGIAGLVPQKRGPRGPHKVQGDVLAFLQQQVVAGEPIRARQLAKVLRREFRLEVHPRTIERALRGKKTVP
ncbi:MAG TPA: helix-turn-helix domain-containing protein [Acidimicrobiales bacterium]|nr:helix-turn-helix domain-containing protein [Acidimicrobiales bacterium]